MKIKELSKWIDQMSYFSYIALKAGLMISCFLLGLSLILLVFGGGLTIDNYSNYLLAKELGLMPISVLLISIIGSACLEDIHKK